MVVGIAGGTAAVAGIDKPVVARSKQPAAVVADTSVVGTSEAAAELVEHGK